MIKPIATLFVTAVITIFVLGCAREKPDIRTSGKLYMSEVDNEIGVYNINDKKSEVVHSFNNDSASLNQVLSIASDNKGSKIIFVVDNHKNKQVFNLLSINLASCSVDTVVRNATQQIDYPAIAPSDTLVAVLAVGDHKMRHYWFLPKNVGFDDLPDARLMMVSVKRKTCVVVVTPPLALSKPSWSADGKSLWVSTYDGNIIQVGLDGSISNAGYKGYCPSLSPDGRSLAYMKGRTLYVRDLSNNKVKSIASSFSKYMPREYCMTFITWSPDSKYILYQGQDFLSYVTHWRSQYVIVPVDGDGAPTVVKDVVAGAFAPAWVP